MLLNPWSWGRIRRPIPPPQGILVLGGHPDRERFSVTFAQQHPGLDLWFSSGMAASDILKLFAPSGIDPARLHFDRRAVDTVTNFTTLVEDFHQRRLRHLYLITSDYHMARSQAIAFWVLGSRGIVITPVSVASQGPAEARWRIVRDVARSWLWLVTGQTGAETRRWLRKKELKQRRLKARRAARRRFH